MHDYFSDPIGKECLALAEQCKATIGFGAVLVKDGNIIGYGRNRRSTAKDRYEMKYIDCAIHAEQDCILDALRNGEDVRGGAVFVLGKVLIGKNKGKLTTRRKIEFICHKCPHAFIEFGLSVYIPHIDGWKVMTGEEALATGQRYYHKGHWKHFAGG